MKNSKSSNSSSSRKSSFFAVLSLLLLLLLSFNGASIFSVKIPSPDFSTHLQEEAAGGDSRNLMVSSLSSSSSANLIYAVKDENPPVLSETHLKFPAHSPGKTAAGAGDANNSISLPSLMEKVQQEENPSAISKTHLRLLRKSHSLSLESDTFPPKRKKIFKLLTSILEARSRRIGDFRERVKEFFDNKNGTFPCKVRFFMTWISSLNSFGDREFYSIETLFKTHPTGCLLIVSNSMDSRKGNQILRPFLDKGYRVTAVSPDFNYLFKNTMAKPWFLRLIRGKVRPGDVPLGQNLSNLLRLCLLYKFGGVYVDSDVVFLKSFSKLKNSIGAQTLDLDTKNWSRLNNAIMMFDKMHPLVYKFIEEFALTFNGHKWGHNGPYLVSRVVARLQGRPGYNFTVLPPAAFYPVNWSRVQNLFRGAKSETDSKWLRGKLRQIRSQSYAVHLWNKQSKGLHIEDGSILRKILSENCVFCNSSAMALVADESSYITIINSNNDRQGKQWSGLLSAG